MKKFMSLVLMLSMFSALIAQESPVLTSKNGFPVLPEKGDIAIGINAASLLSMFKDGSGGPSFDFIADNTLMMKYFLSDNSAVRAVLRLGTASLKVGDDGFENFAISSETNIHVGAGYERRLGAGRVQGFFGADGKVIYSAEKVKDSDDNVMVDLSGFGFGIGAFVGAEYFIAPKLSLGGQFSWGVDFLSQVDKESNDKANAFVLDVDNLGGAIMLIFHF